MSARGIGTTGRHAPPIYPGRYTLNDIAVAPHRIAETLPREVDQLLRMAILTRMTAFARLVAGHRGEDLAVLTWRDGLVLIDDRAIRAIAMTPLTDDYRFSLAAFAGAAVEMD
ncbi:MAG: hypothetical protein NXI16_09370 [Alphaproteobacteria bacterium]|nr:hypothetical protein [Alphaproteobacteria bacterium]